MRALYFSLFFMLSLSIPLVAVETGDKAARSLFLVMFEPGSAWVQDRPMAQQDLREHAAYHARLVKEGQGFAAGGYVGEDGGMAIMRAQDHKAVQALLDADPAIQNRVFKATVRQWQPRFVSDTALIDQTP